MTELIRQLSYPDDIALPPFARAVLLAVGAQREALAAKIGRVERRLMAWDRQDPASQRLETSAPPYRPSRFGDRLALRTRHVYLP